MAAAFLYDLAGTRVRKAMQDIRKMAQNIRVKILDLRNQNP